MTPTFMSPLRTPGSTTTSPSHSTSASYQELVTFKKVTKCNTAAFETFNDDKYYDVFHQGLTATARAIIFQTSVTQITSSTKQILMSSYSFPNNKTLFSLSTIKIIQTDFGRSLVRKHNQDHDAQVVLKELHEYHTNRKYAFDVHSHSSLHL